jgi:hypothetical protein
MRQSIFALTLTAALLAAAPELRAQGNTIELSRFDIVGLKLGQSLQEAIEILKKHNPKFQLDIRRVGLEKWDNQPGCIEEVVRQDGGSPFGPLPSMCGNWSDGMRFGPRDREEQKKIRPDDSLIAGLIAYDDQREFGPPRRVDNYLSVRDLVRAGEEIILLLVTPEPGKEKVTLISRAKSYPENSVGFDDLKSQIFERYAASASTIEGLESMGPRSISILNLYLGSSPLTRSRDERTFSHCRNVYVQDFNPSDSESSMIQPAWPSQIGAQCGNVIRAHVKSYYNNNRYAHGFSAIWFDQQALFTLSRERVLVAKRLRDSKFKPTAPAKKETF